jgi:hypothetical protein
VSRDQLAPMPLFISDANSVAVVGRPFRRVRETARALGVPVLRKGRLVDAAAFRSAVLTAAPANEGQGPAEAVDGVLAALGRRRAG